MIIKKENLEQLLVANWTQFIDTKLLRSFVQDEVPKNLNGLINIPIKKPSINSSNISLSRMYRFHNGYIIWIEFISTLENKVAEGTIEAFIDEEKCNIKLISINGNLYFR